MIAYL